MNDVVINKIQSIQRCVLRAREEYTLAEGHFAQDLSRQDAAVLNITRACEQAIDLANHVLKQYMMGIPNTSAEGFELLARNSVITPELASKLQRMVGFRNLAIHQYQTIDIPIIQAVIESGLDDLVVFTEKVAGFVSSS